MLVSDHGQVRLNVPYLVYCETWMSLLLPEQESEVIEGFNQCCLCILNKAEASLYTHKQCSAIIR